jgi:aryl-alcohol dehydrogenase-like predicted oxidoreductase
VKYRMLGSSQLQVSVVGLGAINFGDPKRLGDHQASVAVIHRALDEGVNFIDTADQYAHGESETCVGKALAGRRRDAIIATKFKLSDVSRGDTREGETVRERIMRSVDASLRRLGTDYIDLYQIHHPEPDVPHEEILEPLSELVAQGKVRYIGESNYAAWRHAQSDAVSARHGWPTMVSCQGLYHLLRRHVELELLPFCTANSVGFLPYRPLAGGWLTGKYQAGSPVQSTRRVDAFSGDERSRQITAGLEAYAAAHGRTMLELSFGWLLAHPAVSSVIAGAMSPEQISANARAGSWELTLEERDEIDAIAAWDGTGKEVEEPGRHTILRTRR